MYKKKKDKKKVCYVGLFTQKKREGKLINEKKGRGENKLENINE